MITQKDLQNYRGPSLMRSESFLYLRPHPALRPYLSHYTITFPQRNAQTQQYTIMPTASSTMVFSVGGGEIVSGLRGVNTKACHVGAFANQFHMLLLVEFHPGGLYPFLPVEQDLLLDSGLALDDLNQQLDGDIRQILDASADVAPLIAGLNALFLTRLEGFGQIPALQEALFTILAAKGQMESHELSRRLHYSQKQLHRLFQRHIGTGIKTFSRIVRTNHALRLMDAASPSLLQIAHQSGYFDQPHFIRDFKAICGVSPGEYLKNKSIFYNETFKL